MKNSNTGILDYFSVLVIGKNPDEKIVKFDAMDDVDTPYVIYSYKDINKLRKERIKVYELFLDNVSKDKDRSMVNEKIVELKSMSDDDYYASLGELYGYDSNNNIISNENPMGKWITCEKGGRVFSKYIHGVDGNFVTSEIKNMIDWSVTHKNLNKVNVYSRTWDLCVNKVTPSSDWDKMILRNMSKYDAIFKNFRNKEEYIDYNTSFWAYAVIDDHGMWFDMENENEIEWISKFYDNYIDKLPDDTLITIYECTK